MQVSVCFVHPDPVPELGGDEGAGDEHHGAGGEDGALVAGHGRVRHGQQRRARDAVHGNAEPGQGGEGRFLSSQFMLQ